MSPLKALQFEVFGKVQGVYFRAGTVDQAQRLGLVGWVANTKPRGSVVGEAQGPADRVAQMKEWLEKVGSPGSRIDRCECQERQIERLDYSSFERRPNVSSPLE